MTRNLILIKIRDCYICLICVHESVRVCAHVCRCTRMSAWNPGVIKVPTSVPAIPLPMAGVIDKRSSAWLFVSILRTQPQVLMPVHSVLHWLSHLPSPESLLSSVIFQSLSIFKLGLKVSEPLDLNGARGMKQIPGEAQVRLDCKT